MRHLRLAGVLLVVIGTVLALSPFPASSEEPPVSLSELDRLRVQVLALEREVIIQRFATAKAQADFAHASKQSELEALVREIAEREGFDLAAWMLDLPSLTWKPRPEAK